MKIDSWVSLGDANPECGGLYVKHVGASDYVEAVECIPESEVGGRDNVFLIIKDGVCIPCDNDKRKSAFECIGYETYGPPELIDLVYAMNAYWGLDDISGGKLVQIGKAQEYDGNGFGDIDTVKPYNLDLMRYLEHEYLN